MVETKDGAEVKHECRTIAVVGQHVACVECGQHEMFLEIGSADLARLLNFVAEIYDTISAVGMNDTAQQLRQRAGELVVNKRLVWRAP